MARIGQLVNQHRLRDSGETEDCPLPKANWGRGRLQRYQSFLSFAATFCALNLLKPRRFRDYWENSFPRCEGDAGLSRIASFLDEPMDVVETVFGDGWHANFGWISRREGFPWSNTVSYCPACIAMGFHSHFHEDPKLSRCLTHHIELRRSYLPPRVSCRSDQYVESLTQLFEQACESWPVKVAQIQMHSDAESHAQLNEYLRWEDYARHAMDGWHGLNCTLHDLPQPYRFSHLDIQLGRLAWGRAMSEKLSDSLVVKPWSVTPIIYQCHDDLAHEMAELVDKLDFTILLRIYRTSKLLEAGEVSYRPLVDNVIDTLVLDHDPEQCQCSWGKTRYAGWMQFASREVRKFYSSLCPHRYAAKELSDEWIRAIPEERGTLESALFFYQRGVALLIDRGLGQVISSVGDKWGRELPLVRLHCSLDALRLLDIILSMLMKAHIEELLHWIAAIRAGTRPDYRDYFPPSVFLVRNHRGIDSVLSWPTGGSRSLEDEATKSWRRGFTSRNMVSAG